MLTLQLDRVDLPIYQVSDRDVLNGTGPATERNKHRTLQIQWEPNIGVTQTVRYTLGTDINRTENGELNGIGVLIETNRQTKHRQRQRLIQIVLVVNKQWHPSDHTVCLDQRIKMPSHGRRVRETFEIRPKRNGPGKPLRRFPLIRKYGGDRKSAGRTTL